MELVTIAKRNNLHKDNERKDELMKNKRLLTFLPLVLVSFLMFGACGKKQPEPEPTPVGPVTPAKSIYDVNFYVGDEIVYSTKVEEGSLAFYSGDIPTKEPDDMSG